MPTYRRYAGSLGIAVALAAAATPAMLQPASAAPVVGCGSTITSSVVLTADVGPCLHSNGLDIMASNITVDLNGHMVIGSHGVAPRANHEQVGINLDNVHGVTVENGTVTLFDAGVSLKGGHSNTVTHVTATHNVNVNTLEPSVTTTCNFGDGIVLDNSRYDMIMDNSASDNGPFDGIGLVNSSISNSVVGNHVFDNDVINLTTGGSLTICGGQGPKGRFARPIQDIGINLEGPGAANNDVMNNTVTNNALYGIAIHANFCGKPPLVTPPNTNNLIENNVVTLTGTEAAINAQDPTGTGIGTLQQGEPTVVCAATDNDFIGNVMDGNFSNGLTLSAPSSQNVIVGNTANGNGQDGLYLAGPATPPSYGGVLDSLVKNNTASGNGLFDAADFNDGCTVSSPRPLLPTNREPNTWQRGGFGTVNQICAAHGGTAVVAQVLLQNFIYAGPQVSIVTSPSALSTPWTDDVTVSNASGFQLYSDTACTQPLGTGTGIAGGNGTMVVAISFNNVAGAKAFTIAAASVSGANGSNPAVPNAAVGCRAIGSGSTVAGA